MTETTFTLRQLNPRDGSDYASLLAACPDTGAIGSAVRFEIDPYQALLSLHRDTVGVVAGTPGIDGFVGSGLIRFGQCQWEGEVRPSALLNTLVVHPVYRRMGLASRLAGWRQEFTLQRQGEGGVMWALIQQNNTGSERTAARWAGQFLAERLVVAPLKMRSSPPPCSDHFAIRPAQPDELDTLAEQLNRYYRDYNLYSPETGSSLAAWLAETPFASPFHHYRIVTDQAGSILAGVGLAENYRLRTILITHLPAGLRLLNRILKIIPASGEIREIALSRLWHAPGRLDAARHLVEAMRWEWREKGTSLLFFTDVRSQMISLLGVQDRFSREVTGVALRAPVPCTEGRLFYYA